MNSANNKGISPFKMRYLMHKTRICLPISYPAPLTIANERDCQKMQEDLHNLEQWENEWQMCFHPEKCQVVSISRKKNPIKYTYRLQGQALKAALLSHMI